MLITLSWLIFWLPFIIAVAITLFFLKAPKIAAFLATTGMALCFTLSLCLLVKYQNHHFVIENTITWMKVGNVPIEFGILLNGLTILMLLVVTGIGTLVFLFSTSYMSHEEGQSRYFASLSLFAFSMLGIVLGGNLIQIFIFWELVGVSSYLLIGFWFEKDSASTASKKAFITTRVGDVGMMIGILLLFGYLATNGVGTFNFLELKALAVHTGHQASPLAQMIPTGVMTAIVLLIFMGVIGKSAQVPLHVWLPDAMEGPTPVSALIHAATMVAAGIFLVARLSFLFEISHDAMMIIAWLGGITALIAGSVAIVQNDIKKVLAYSTLSQLGYMVLALGLANPEAGMFHLTTHAFFKALLFLGSGSLIHALHTQDIWDMSGQNLLKKMPITSWTFLIATAALMGIPPLSGFWSKEAILAAAQGGPKLLFILSLAVVFFTSFYMGRLCTVVFFNPNKNKESSHSPHEGGWAMTLPLLILAVLSVVAGFIPFKELMDFGHHGDHHGEHHHGLMLAIGSLSLALGGAILSFILYRKTTVGARHAVPLQTILEKKYYFDEFYDGLIKYVQENIALASDWFERIVVVEGAANGTARVVQIFGNILRKLQTGIVQFYALVFTAGITVIIYCLILKG